MTLKEFLRKGRENNLIQEEMFDFFDSEEFLDFLGLEKKDGKYIEKPYIPPPRFGENDYFWDEVIFLPQGYELNDLPFYHTRVFVEDSNYGNRVEFVDDTYPQDYGILLTLQETILREIPVKVYPTTDLNLIFYFTIHGGKVI